MPSRMVAQFSSHHDDGGPGWGVAVTTMTWGMGVAVTTSGVAVGDAGVGLCAPAPPTIRLSRAITVMAAVMDTRLRMANLHIQQRVSPTDSLMPQILHK